ncbi:MAG TPA: S41 family peptidase [Lacunisphaera sp.]|jgi:carboxyl-terminal processing protease
MSVIKRCGTLLLLVQLALGQLMIPNARGGSIDTQLTTAEKQQLQREARLVVDLLQNSHYSGRSFREIDNKTMLARFLEELDPQADIFSADSVDSIHRRFDRTLKSVYLFRGDLQPAFEIFDQFITQAHDRMAWAQKRLDQGFDFTLDETYVERAKPEPFKMAAEADRHWELTLKEWVLVERLRGRTPDAAVAEVKRRCTEIDRTIATFDSLSVRERFFDAIIRSFDPHSGYFSSDSAREFAVEMEKSIVGLGVDLRKESGRCVVAAVEAGGSVDMNSGIAPGDVIEALAEGDEAWKPVEKLRLREIVGLMRGEPGTKVRVAYLPGGSGDRREVSLERSRIVLGADRAHGAVSRLSNPSGKSRRIGWIELPSFYAAGENAATTSAARDVRELLRQMTTTPMNGLVIDLRDNPGGALSEAAALSELFVPKGLMLLSRGLDGQLKEHTLKEGQPVYDGPLVILISANSASASEVFAGAMKYHRRALIVGAAATFGKGSMQNYIDVSKMAGREANDWGTLRLTMERFYLPDGKSVQRTGIPADIVFPAFENPDSHRREADLPGAFAAETVAAPSGLMPVSSAVSFSLVGKLQETATHDFNDLPEWKILETEQKLWQTSVSHEPASLNFEKRSKAWREQIAALEIARANRRAITLTNSYPTEPYEIEAATKAREIHEAKLRLASLDGRPLLHRLAQGSFVVETQSGHLRKLRLDAVNFSNYSGDTAALASAFSAGSHLAVTPSAVGDFLREIALLEHKNDAAILAAAAKMSGGAASADATRNGTESLLAALAALDGEVLRERRGLDVPLRESLRLTAAWAAWKEASTKP